MSKIHCPQCGNAAAGISADARCKKCGAFLLDSSRLDAEAAFCGISFMDNVRVRATPLTAERGLAGRIGQVCGETVPSGGNIDAAKVFGELTRDYALNVRFKDPDESHWFAPELLELVNHGAGTEISIAGKKWRRSESGQWLELKKWWQFWK